MLQHPSLDFPVLDTLAFDFHLVTTFFDSGDDGSAACLAGETKGQGQRGSGGTEGTDCVVPPYSGAQPLGRVAHGVIPQYPGRDCLCRKANGCLWSWDFNIGGNSGKSTSSRSLLSGTYERGGVRTSDPRTACITKRLEQREKSTALSFSACAS